MGGRACVQLGDPRGQHLLGDTRFAGITGRVALERLQIHSLNWNIPFARSSRDKTQDGGLGSRFGLLRRRLTKPAHLLRLWLPRRNHLRHGGWSTMTASRSFYDKSNVVPIYRPIMDSCSALHRLTTVRRLPQISMLEKRSPALNLTLEKRKTTVLCLYEYEYAAL